MLDKVRDPAANSEPIVGNGDRCVPGDDSNCGDEGPAIQAKLAHPKGQFIHKSLLLLSSFYIKKQRIK